MAESRRVYLDHNATSPLRPEVAEAFVRALALAGNPSSVHAEGRAARAAIETAREKVAALIGASPKNTIFTSGGTEANNLVLSPSFRRAGGSYAKGLLAGATEHPSVLAGHRFEAQALTLLPVDAQGIVDLDRLSAQVTSDALVSLQAANNETGTLQPIAEAAAIVHAAGALIHADAVQAAGKIPLDMERLGVDALTLSGHKIGGPKGIGALVLGSDRLEIAERLLRGGGQERGHRAGTENVAAIAGFGVAAELAAGVLAGEALRLAAMRDELEVRIRQAAPDAVIFADKAERLPNTLAFAIPGLSAETALIAFDLEGIALSSGSACSSGKVRRSHVLDAMGADAALAGGGLRLSLGWSTTQQDIALFAQACERVVSNLYKRKANAA